MRLELADFPVKQIRLGHRFRYENQVLEVDEAALLALISQDARISAVTLAVASPGERTRITGIQRYCRAEIQSFRQRPGLPRCFGRG